MIFAVKMALKKFYMYMCFIMMAMMMMGMNILISDQNLTPVAHGELWV